PDNCIKVFITLDGLSPPPFNTKCPLLFSCWLNANAMMNTTAKNFMNDAKGKNCNDWKKFFLSKYRYNDEYSCFIINFFMKKHLKVFHLQMNSKNSNNLLKNKDKA